MPNLRLPSGSPRLQFSLRTALACTALLAVGFAYLLRQDRKRLQQIADIERAGGTVTFDDSIPSLFPSARLTGVSIPYSSVDSVDTSRLTLFANLTELSMTDGDITLADGTQLHFRVLQTKLKPGDEPRGFFSRVETISTPEPSN